MRIARSGNRIALFARTNREATYLRVLDAVLPSTSDASAYVDQFDSSPFSLFGLPKHKKGDTAILVLASKYFRNLRNR